jgi:hypothetical protein
VIAQKPLHPLAHLTGCFIGERNREDRRAGDPMIPDQVRDPVSDYTGLAGAGSSEEQQRAFDVFNSFFLLGIEPLEKIHVFFILPAAGGTFGAFRLGISPDARFEPNRQLKFVKTSNIFIRNENLRFLEAHYRHDANHFLPDRYAEVRVVPVISTAHRR